MPLSGILQIKRIPTIQYYLAMIFRLSFGYDNRMKTAEVWGQQMDLLEASNVFSVNRTVECL